ncbi:MAG: hypothetical protein ABI548_11895 [Polyangiaceae bacterium]
MRRRMIEENVARPIEPTPTLEGAAAEKLLNDLAAVCSPSEARARVDWARQQRAAMLNGEWTLPALNSGKPR